MKFSIITVCYNAQSLIRNTIESVLKQDYQDFEYLIIDGKSCDNTVSIIEEYRDKRVKIYSEGDFGIYNAMNRGVCRAKGEFIYFLNAGDVLHSANVLSKVVEYLVNDKTIYYGSVKLVKPGSVDMVSDYSLVSGSIADKFFEGLMPCHQAIFAPKDSLINHFFHEKYKLRADYQWFYNSVFLGFFLESIPVIIADYQVLGESGNIINMGLMKKETQQIQREYFENRKVTIPEMKLPPKTEFEWKKIADKHLKIVKLMDNWLSIKQNGISLMKYFDDHNISSIAIYGLGYIGLRLLKELEHNNIVKYAIDQKKIQVNTPVIGIDDKLDLVDAIVVTTVNDYDEVIALLTEKINCWIVRFDDVIQFCMENLKV